MRSPFTPFSQPRPIAFLELVKKCIPPPIQLSSLHVPPFLSRVDLWSAEKFCQAHCSVDGSIASSQARTRFQCLHILLSENKFASLKAQIKRDYQDWYREVGFLEKDRVSAVLWAREQLSQKDWVILDTETTGLVRAEIVEIAIINHLGELLLDTLIKPSIPIPPEVTEIHGISDAMVADAPTFPEVYPRIDAALKDKRVLIYNSAFDVKILNYCCRLHNLPILKLKKRSECLMEWAAQWGGDWSYYYKDYKYFPLPSGNHRALGDCLAAFELIKLMAADSDQINCPVPIPQKNS